ncbi:MAG: NADH-quinone oxidoreductase subunit J [Acidimicrobiia bacterium]
MIAQQVAFWIIAVAMAGAAIGVVRSQNVVHAALYLVAVLAGSAAQFLLLAAEFVAWVQVIVYIGAVVVLFLFGIMLTRAPMRAAGDVDYPRRWPAFLAGVFVFAIFSALTIHAFGAKKIALNDSLLNVGNAATVGGSVFRSYVLPFEVVSILLLAALVGAVVLARRD